MSALRRGRILWLRIALILFVVLIVIGSQDLYLRGLGTGNGEFLGAFSVKWGLGLIGYGIIALGIVFFTLYGILQPQRWMERIFSAEKFIERSRILRWILAVGFVIFPVAFILGPWGWRFDLPNFRVMLLVCFSILGGFFLPLPRVHWLERIVLLILLSSSLFVISQQFMQVSDYPFAASWSEGNRLWDYSLYFWKDRYNIEPPFSYPTYLTPGRHGLWGLPFLLLSNPSIVIMRIWDVVLWTLPYLLLGLVLFKFRQSVLTTPWQWVMVLWTFLFLSQGPIYAPLILSGFIFALGYHREHLWRSLILTALACFYAGISRWTWMVAPAVWAVLWALIDENVKEDFWIRLKRPFLLGVAGLIGAILSLIVMDLAFPRPDAIYSTSLSQPLLWYRLWSSATNPTGVVRGLIYAVGPVIIWLVWIIIRQRARWDWLKILAVLAALLAFLAVGLAASVKIGGGSNIHNLDMFLVSLVFLVAMIATSRDGFSNYPGYAWALLALVLFLPVWNLTRFHTDVEIPVDSNPQEVISEIRSTVQEAAKEGEVLFIDQRQLFTFGHITDVPLVMEYELKHMMNQAMAHNQAYFETFRSDLENHRFRLIVSDPLYIVFQGPKIAFGEENDAWVEEVTIPILHYYEPVMRFDKDLIWLLAPKEGE
jgi:hypothetical protein